MSDCSSYSRVTTYEQCPRKYRYKYIDKVKVKEDKERSKGANRGKKIHERIEEFIKNPLMGRWPTKLIRSKFWRDYFRTLRESPGLMTQLESERHVMVRRGKRERAWVCTDLKTEALIQGFLDISYLYDTGGGAFIMVIEDIKTGSINKLTGKVHLEAIKKHRDQLKLYASLWWHKLNLDQVHVIAIELKALYVDTEDFIATEVLDIGDLPPIRHDWNKRLELIASDSIMAATPNRLCNWCDYSRYNGGSCVF